MSTQPAPLRIRRAVALLWSSLAVGVVIFFLELRSLDSAEAGWVVWFVPGAVLAIMVLFTISISRGQNWARVAFLVFFAAGGLPYLFVLADMWERSATTASLSVAELLMQAVAMYLLFTKPDSLWFRRPNESASGL